MLLKRYLYIYKSKVSWGLHVYTHSADIYTYNTIPILSHHYWEDVGVLDDKLFDPKQFGLTSCLIDRAQCSRLVSVQTLTKIRPARERERERGGGGGLERQQTRLNEAICSLIKESWDCISVIRIELGLH